MWIVKIMEDEQGRSKEDVRFFIWRIELLDELVML
jgi:hypothetical protein